MQSRSHTQNVFTELSIIFPNIIGDFDTFGITGHCCPGTEVFEAVTDKKVIYIAYDPGSAVSNGCNSASSISYIHMDAENINSSAISLRVFRLYIGTLK